MAKKQGCLAQSEYRLFQCINTIVDFGFIILYIINSIFLILGHIIVIGTTYTLVEYSDWLELARQQQNVVVLLLMGIFTLFVGIIGIVGANRLQRSDGNLNNMKGRKLKIMYLYITCVFIITCATLGMAIGMDWFIKNLNEPKFREDGNHLQNSFKHCDRYVKCSFEYCCDGLDGRAIADQNVTCTGQEKSTVYAMSKEKLCGNLQKKNLLGGSSCSDYDTYQVRIYDWMQEKFKPVVDLAKSVGMVLTIVFISSVFVGICKKRKDIIEERNNLPEYKADSGLDDDTKNVKKLLEKDDFKKKAELAYIDSHGYSTVQV